MKRRSDHRRNKKMAPQVAEFFLQPTPQQFRDFVLGYSKFGIALHGSRPRVPYD